MPIHFLSIVAYILRIINSQVASVFVPQTDKLKNGIFINISDILSTVEKSLTWTDRVGYTTNTFIHFLAVAPSPSLQ